MHTPLHHWLAVIDNLSVLHSYATVSSAPYRGRSTNVGVGALNLLIFLAGCTAEAIALEAAPETALVLQQTFGIASAVTVTGTLLALTPVGSSWLFNDTHVHKFAASGDGTSATTQHDNPVLDGIHQ